MIAELAPAKINLALHVLGRRADGYHELDSIVAFADIGDRLEIAPSTEFSIMTRGPFAASLPAAPGNIVQAAWQLASATADERGQVLPPVRITLEKNLPVASGIGGGSADAAAALRGCLRLAGITVDDAVRRAALRLGADVPVCLLGRACRMRGMGERIEPLANFTPLHAVLVNPGVAVPTGEVFAGLGLRRGQSHAAAIPEDFDLAALRNDMTDAAIAVAPAIAEVLRNLDRTSGCNFARMSGSGATCFAIFQSAQVASLAASALEAAHRGWWVRTVSIG